MIKEHKRKETNKEAKKETITELVKELEKIRDSKVVSLFFNSVPITSDIVNDVYDSLNSELKEPVEKLDVIIDSGGGDIDAAFHLVKILRKYVTTNGHLTFIIPRYAKSAATLMACGGDSILMGITSEIGPLDPQITRLEIGDKGIKGGETFSPLSISSTIDFLKFMIKEGIEKKQKENILLAEMLVKNLLPLSLGQYLKTLDIGKDYAIELLTTRMFKEDKNKAKKIADKLVKGYSHHGYCIDVDEAKELGFNIEDSNKEQWDLIWKIYRIYEMQYKIYEDKMRRSHER